MGLHRFKPMPSGRMGIFWTLSCIKEAAIVEFGCMGHNLYGGSALRRAGVYEGYGAGLYTTYIDETDISLGDTGRLAATIKHVVAADRPKAVFLLPSAVPEVIGTDLLAISRELQPMFPEVKILPIGHGSFAISQHRGVQEALLALVSALPKDREDTGAPISAAMPASASAPTFASDSAVTPAVATAPITASASVPSFNIIGSCPDVFRYAADAAEITRLMKSAFGFEPCCILSSGASVSDIERMGEARVNLAIRREGVPAARRLLERFGTPYVYDRPYGIEGTSEWLRAVGKAIGREPDAAFMESERALAMDQIDQAYDYLEGNEWSYPEEAVLSIGGHADVVKGILAFATKEIPMRKGICWCDCPEMGDAEIPFFSEAEWIPVVQNHKKGYLMFSGEALRWAGKNTQLQVTNPDASWRIHPYEPPFVGYRGAVHLVNLWINEHTLTH